MKLYQCTISGAIMLVRAESPESADRLARRRRRQQLAMSENRDHQILAAQVGNEGPIDFTTGGKKIRIDGVGGKESAALEIPLVGPEEVVSVLVPRE